MAAIRLKHPEHGYHYVYTPTELEEHKAIGWVIDEPMQQQETKPQKKVKHGNKHIYRA